MPSPTISAAAPTAALLAEYANIPIAYEVNSVFSAEAGGDGGFELTERPPVTRYRKDYDSFDPDRPQSWPTRFDTSRWAMLLARAHGELVGGATVAWDTEGLDMLEGRQDLAVIWDLRVAPAARGRGVGQALFGAVEEWARGRGCRELKVETQDVNVPACRFYLAMGCVLRSVNPGIYPECPHEVQFLWHKALGE